MTEVLHLYNDQCNDLQEEIFGLLKKVDLMCINFFFYLNN